MRIGRPDVDASLATECVPLECVIMNSSSANGVGPLQVPSIDVEDLVISGACLQEKLLPIKRPTLSLSELQDSLAEVIRPIGT